MSNMYEDMRKIEERHNLVITSYVSVEDIKAEIDEVRDEQINLTDETIFGIIQWCYRK